MLRSAEKTRRYCSFLSTTHEKSPSSREVRDFSWWNVVNFGKTFDEDFMESFMSQSVDRVKK